MAAIDFPDTPQIGDIFSEGGTSWEYDGTVWNVVSSNNEFTIPNVFQTIHIAGNTDVVADSTNTTLQFVAGSNVTLTTDPSAKSITIAASPSGGGGGEENQNAFSQVAVTGQETITADTKTDTINFIAGTGIQITTDAEPDEITITNTETVITNFSALVDSSTAGLTVDEFYLPAITRLDVTNNGASAYRFDQYGTDNNPTIYAINGTTIAFKLNVEGHPFLIQTPAGTNYDTGLVHVSTTGTVSTGANAQGKTSGTLYWKIPSSISGGYRYQCSVHAAMVGSITIKNFGTI